MTVGNTAHVHHMVVFTCDSLNTTDPGGPCDDVSKGLSSCLEGIPIVDWTVGGPVSARFLCNLFYGYCTF